MNKNRSLSGPAFLLEGFRKIPDPQLRWFVLWPLLINIFVFSGMWYWAGIHFNDWMAWLTNWLPDWLRFMEYLLWPVFALGMLGIMFFTFTIVGNFIAAPFNALLAEKVQSMEGATLPTMKLKDWLIIIPKSIGRELQKLLYYLPRALLLLILSFIPVINLVSPILWFVFNGWMMTVQYCDYAADNRSVSFKTMIKQLKNHRPGTWSFGALVSLVMLIPLINLFVIPVAVVGATLLWERRIEATSRSRETI